MLIHSLSHCYFMDLPLKVKPSSRVGSWLGFREDLDKAYVVEVASAFDDWHSVYKLLHNDMIVPAEDYVNVWNSIGEIAILVVPHMSESDDYITSEVIFQMRGRSL